MGGRDYPFQQVGPRRAPNVDEVQPSFGARSREAGARAVPAEARAFQRRAASEVRRYPEVERLPRWVLALVEKKVSAEEFAGVVRSRVERAPTAGNLELAMLLVNELGRRPDGPQLLDRYLTPDLIERLGRAGEPQ